MTHPEISSQIQNIFLGNIQDRREDKPPSAIQKDLVHGRQEVNLTGFTGDAQADLSVHGGKEKAIHHYAFEHYATWQSEGHLDIGTEPAAFGENIVTTGFTEENLCIGDILKLGTVTVQISQGRQPCWKLGLHTGNKNMPYLFQKTGRTGWYYRVLEPGYVEAGDSITLVERRNSAWTVQRVTHARLTRKVSLDDAKALADLSDLAPGWRKAFAKMADGDNKEDTRTRLQG